METWGEGFGVPAVIHTWMEIWHSHMSCTRWLRVAICYDGSDESLCGHQSTRSPTHKIKSIYWLVIQHTNHHIRGYQYIIFCVYLGFVCQYLTCNLCRVPLTSLASILEVGRTNRLWRREIGGMFYLKRISKFHTPHGHYLNRCGSWLSRHLDLQKKQDMPRSSPGSACSMFSICCKSTPSVRDGDRNLRVSRGWCVLMWRDLMFCDREWDTRVWRIEEDIPRNDYIEWIQ